MQLDKTCIAVRERSLLDILDLALLVGRHYWAPLLICLVVIALPLMLLNDWLIGWMTDNADDPDQFVRYLTTMVLLVVIEAPLCGILITAFLGQAVFLERPSVSEMITSTAQATLPLFWCLVLWRGILLAVLLVYWIPRDSSYSESEGFLVVLAIIVLLIRGLRPFVLEIILLERSPLWSKDKQTMTIRRRSTALHGPNSGDLFSRWLGSSSIAAALVFTLIFTLWFIVGMLIFDWTWGPIMLRILIPAAMWTIVGYFSVVRFLSYLDLRIRREGWEVELKIRAAAGRLLEGALV